MEVIRTVELLREFAGTRREVALVPTMGNLHEGHASLIEAARKKTPNVVVSVFVNPTQFGQGEDYESYPRTPETDAGIAEEMGAAAVFAPSVKEMYPEPQNYFVEPPALAHELCGVTRPIHFRGVCTVVLKLLIAANPRWAFFGKKDYQQLVIVKGLARQFNLPVEIVGVETKRAADGLALSSRNQYLSADERAKAPELSRALNVIKQCLEEPGSPAKNDCPSAAKDAAKRAADALTRAGWGVDYVEVRNAESLAMPQKGDKRLVALAAARLGKTRLIDNIEIALR